MPENYEEIPYYIKGQKAFGARPGDKVFIFRAAEDYTHGWNNTWVTYMNDAIGHYGTVLPDNNAKANELGILLDVPNMRVFHNECRFPYFCLQIKR